MGGLRGHMTSYSMFFLHAENELESWWLLGVEEIFGSSLTSATSTVLESELGSCKELLELEPDNKCM